MNTRNYPPEVFAVAVYELKQQIKIKQRKDKIEKIINNINSVVR